MKRLVMAAVGFALVVGIAVGGLLGNPFDGKASASTVAVGGRLISLGTQNLVAGNPYLSPFVATSDCSQLVVMSTSSNPAVYLQVADFLMTSPDGTTPNAVMTGTYTVIDTQGGYGRVPDPYPYVSIYMSTSGSGTSDVTAWLWCVTGSPTYAVGGIAELPALAGPGSTSGMGGTTYAVLAGAAAGVLAFAVLATLSVKKWGAR